MTESICNTVLGTSLVLYITSNYHVMPVILAIVALVCLVADKYLPERPVRREPTADELNELRQAITQLKADVSRANLAVGLRAGNGPRP